MQIIQTQKNKKVLILFGLFVVGIIIVVLIVKSYKSDEQESKIKKNYLQIEEHHSNIEYFGYKSCWMAIKAENNREIADFLKHIEDTSNQKLIFKNPNCAISITSHINGWTFIIGELPTGDSKESLERLKIVLEKLSERFGEVQFYATHRVVEYHCWAKALNGQILRIYSYLGESGENICIEGEPVGVEKNYQLINTFSDQSKEDGYYDSEDLVFPDEALVMIIAENWSLDPTKFNDKDWTKLWTNALTIRQK